VQGLLRTIAVAIVLMMEVGSSTMESIWLKRLPPIRMSHRLANWNIWCQKSVYASTSGALLRRMNFVAAATMDMYKTAMRIARKITGSRPEGR